MSDGRAKRRSVAVRGAVVGILFALGYSALNAFIWRYFALLRKPKLAPFSVELASTR